MEEKYSFIEKLAPIVAPDIDIAEIIFEVVVTKDIFHLVGGTCSKRNNATLPVTPLNLTQLRTLTPCGLCLSEDDYILNSIIDTDLSDALSGYRHLEFMLTYWDYETFVKEIMSQDGVTEIKNMEELRKAFDRWDDFSSEVEYGLYSSPGLRQSREDNLFIDMLNQITDNMNSFQARFFGNIKNELWFINYFLRLAKMEPITSLDELTQEVGVVLGPLNWRAPGNEDYISQAELLMNVFAFYINWEREFVIIPKWVYEVLLEIRPERLHSKAYYDIDQELLATAKILWDKNPENIYYYFDNCLLAAKRV